MSGTGWTPSSSVPTKLHDLIGKGLYGEAEEWLSGEGSSEDAAKSDSQCRIPLLLLFASGKDILSPPPPSSLVDTLISAYPKGPSIRSYHGMFPIHVLVSSFFWTSVEVPVDRDGSSRPSSAADAPMASSWSVVTLQVVNAFRKAASLHDAQGREPLWLACSCAAPLEVVQVLVDQMGSSCLKRGDLFSASLPLHAACGVIGIHRPFDWTDRATESDDVPHEELLSQKPRPFDDRIAHGLSRHDHCFRPQEGQGAQRPEVVKYLLEAYPAAAQTEDRYGFLPLHYACHGRAPLSVVGPLLEAHPDGAGSPNSMTGNFPLHVACDFMAPVEVVSELVRLCPRATWQRNSSGKLPLHLLVMNKVENDDYADMVALLRHVLGPYRGAMFDVDLEGLCPVDLAHRNNTLRDGLLEAAYGGGIDLELQMMPPLHEAIANGAPLTALRVILDAVPKKANAAVTGVGNNLWRGGIGSKDSLGRYPLHVALDHNKWHAHAQGVETSCSIATALPSPSSSSSPSLFEVVKLLLREDASVLIEPDNRGWVPFVVGCLAIASGEAESDNVSNAPEQVPESTVANHSRNRSAVTTLYTVLREDPSVVIPFY